MSGNAKLRKELRIREHGWFHTPDRKGDRTVEQQLQGLSPMIHEVSGKAVLDVGCAEGLVSMECAKAGAIHVEGVEYVAGHIDIARQLQGDLPCEFKVADANDYEPDKDFDIVLLLAVLHKLRNPSKSCATIVQHCTDLCVIRIGMVDTPVILDDRSNRTPHYIGDVMHDEGFFLERKEFGPLNEITWYYRRK